MQSEWVRRKECRRGVIVQDEKEVRDIEGEGCAGAAGYTLGAVVARKPLPTRLSCKGRGCFHGPVGARGCAGVSE